MGILQLQTLAPVTFEFLIGSVFFFFFERDWLIQSESPANLHFNTDFYQICDE